MSTTLPDLWSDDIRVDILSPVAILRAQEGPLVQKTQGLLRASVSSSSTDEWEQHELDLIAPALGGYRVGLLSAKHRKDMVYPVIVTSKALLPKEDAYSLFPRILLPNFSLAVAEVSKEGLSRDQREAATQQEFIELVRTVLRSGMVRAIIQSLIARSNDVQARSMRGSDALPENPEPPPPAEGKQE